jgi:hypothetical protein
MLQVLDAPDMESLLQHHGTQCIKVAVGSRCRRQANFPGYLPNMNMLPISRHLPKNLACLNHNIINNKL